MNATSKPSPELLWPDGAPGSVGDLPADRPTLTAYVPDKPNGASMIVCPGGGYSVVVDHENAPVAAWLNTLGITAFVLVYRVAPRYRHPAMLQDAARAIRTVRSRAEALGLDPNRIGIIGFSAGGHLAASVSVHHDPGVSDSPDPVERVSSRPDVSVLVYPVISFQPELGRCGTGINLLGEHAPSELIDLMSAEKQVKGDTPPAFIYHRRGDPTVPVQHPLRYAQALAGAGVQFELHIYEHVGHGQVFAKGDPIDGDWPERLTNWLRRQFRVSQE